MHYRGRYESVIIGYRGFCAVVGEVTACKGREESRDHYCGRFVSRRAAQRPARPAL